MTLVAFWIKEEQNDSGIENRTAEPSSRWACAVKTARSASKRCLETACSLNLPNTTITTTNQFPCPLLAQACCSFSLSLYATPLLQLRWLEIPQLARNVTAMANGCSYIFIDVVLFLTARHWWMTDSTFSRATRRRPSSAAVCSQRVHRYTISRPAERASGRRSSLWLLFSCLLLM